MTSLNFAQTRKLPISHVTKNRRLRCQALRDYYESKIECLLGMKLPARLITLACWDSPIDREDLTSERSRRRFLKKCLSYYKKRLKDVEQEAKNF
jgi:hypothetical protein